MPGTAKSLAAAQAAEYGKYRAKEPIDFGTARAFNVGDPVPVSHVERGVVREDQVELVEEPVKAAAKPSAVTKEN